MKVLSKSIPLKLKLAYLQCNILKVIAISQIHDAMRKTQTKNIAETCFDTVKHFVVLYILH